jgi:DNA-binding transcriptional LysR family regulator
VKISTEDGFVGWGEATTIGGLGYGEESPESIKTNIETYFAPLLKSLKAQNIAQTMRALKKNINGNRFAKCAIQTALLDIQAQRLDLPLSEVLGGRLRDSLPVLWVLLREEPLMLAAHSSHPLTVQKQGVYLSDLVDQNLFLYPSHPKPNFSTQVQGLFSEYGLEPKHLKEVREIQLALGLVAAGEGICVVPESARTIQLPHLNYIPILDDAATSPIFLAIRSMDESEDIRSLFDCIYQVYDLEAIKYDRAFI